MKAKKDLKSSDIRSLFFHYLIPSIGGMLGTALYVLGDTMLVGRGLGSQGLAALNISIPMINVFNGLGLLFGLGGATALSVSLGQGNDKQINDIFTKSIVLSVIVGILLTIIRIFYLEDLCYLLGASENTIEMSKDYLGLLMSFSTVFVLNVALTVLIRNDGAPKLAMWSMLIGSILNVFLDYVFIFGYQWGMFGGALATVISPIVSLGILSTHFIKKNNTYKLKKPKWQPKLFLRIIKNGMSSFIVELSAGIVIFAFNLSILRITGDIGVSAYSIVANLSLICTAIFTGVGQALQPIVSFNYGAMEMERVYEAVYLALFTALFLGILFYFTGLLFPESLVAIFAKASDSKDLMEITVRGISLYFISFIFMGLNIVVTSYLQSKENSKTSLFLSLARGVVLVVPTLFILSRTKGLDGVWLTLPLVEALTLVISLSLFEICRTAFVYSICKIQMLVRAS